MTFCGLLGHSRPPKSLPPGGTSRPGLLDALKASRSKVQDICTISGVAGASITVIDDGKPVFQDSVGYRDVGRKQPVDSETIFHIASMTKSLTGACVHRLRAQKKLALDDPIHKHLPDAKSRDPTVASTATIADLLGHRTGLQRADSIWLGSGGELMIERDQTVAVYSHLRPHASLRSRFLYNNVCYALLGEIIAKVTGQEYDSYVKQYILDPLDMHRTLVTKRDGLPTNTSLAYSTLDDVEPYNVPLPANSASVAMGSAGGLLSTADDLTKYYKALMKSWRGRTSGEKGGHRTADKEAGKEHIFDDISWLFAPLQIMETPTFREKSYASGWARSQLPTTVGDLGVNPGLMGEMPLLANGVGSRLALWHQGSLVGATSFVMLLPETESAVIVLTNTMALNDAADWIGQLLVEILVDSPIRNDYVHLASVSADRALKRYAQLSQKVEEGREPGGPKKALSKYVGSYVGFGGIFRINVVQGEHGLEILFQGRETQKYHLQHHHDDTFTWFMSWNEQTKRGRFIVWDPLFYAIRFVLDEDEEIVALNWVHDEPISEGENFTRV